MRGQMQALRDGIPLLTPAQIERAGDLPEQLPGESDQAYHAFTIYAREAANLSMTDLAQRAGCAYHSISRWVKRWQWRVRIEQWLHSDKAEKARRAARIAEFHADEYKLHRDILAAARKSLQRWNDSDKIPSLMEVARMAELASRLGRMALGLPTEHAAVAIEATGNIRLHFEEALLRVYGEEEDQKPGAVIDVEAVEKSPNKPPLPTPSPDRGLPSPQQ